MYKSFPFEATPKLKAKIVMQTFITRTELQLLLGLERQASNRIFLQIQQELMSDKGNGGLLPPDNRHLPTNKVLARLADYGITKSSILKDAERSEGSAISEKKAEFYIEEELKKKGYKNGKEISNTVNS